MNKRNRKKTVVLPLAAAVLLLALTACGSGQEGETTPPPETSTLPVETSTPPVETSAPPEETGGTASPDPSPSPTGEAPADGTYDFSQPVPEGGQAAEDYFADAVFIGDSRTEGFLLYSGVTGADGITHTGMNIFQVLDKAVIGTGDSKKTVMQVLSEKQYGKVYLSLGVNELGYQNDTLFYQTYLDVIDAVRECQPDAVIYIENLIPLNESQVSKDYLRNDHLRTYNELMARAAEEKQVAYLDLYSAFVDENGQLPEDASNDGVHLKKPYCQKWLEYLQCHTVTPEQMGLK